MRASRRFSQAISEGDGISLLADVDDADAARAAESDGAEAIIVRGALVAVRDATDLPILWCIGEPLEWVRDVEAVACLRVIEQFEE